jgi:hypothetical protein
MALTIEVAAEKIDEALDWFREKGLTRADFSLNLQQIAEYQLEWTHALRASLGPTPHPPMPSPVPHRVTFADHQTANALLFKLTFGGQA